MAKPEAIIFDLDDTLIADEESANMAILKTIEPAYSQFGIDAEAFRATLREKARQMWYDSPARRYCVKVGISSWEGLWIRFHGDDPEVETLRAWAPVYRRECWRQALAAMGRDDMAYAAHLSEEFRKIRRSFQIVYPEVESTLTELRSEYRLAMLTNGIVDLQSEKVTLSGLDDYFESVTISGEIGVGKPEPAVFDLVLKRLGLSAEEAVMVGNSLTSDIEGAQRAGIRSIWINRDGAECDLEKPPDAEVKSLSEIAAIVAAM